MGTAVAPSRDAAGRDRVGTQDLLPAIVARCLAFRAGRDRSAAHDGARRCPESGHVLGETVNRVGRTTGWTGGEVIATCQNILAVGATFVRRCQARVAGGGDGGDSGSPVFTSNNRRGSVNGGKVILTGILGRLLDGPPEFIYSPMFNIERDLGLLRTH